MFDQEKNFENYSSKTMFSMILVKDCFFWKFQQKYGEGFVPSFSFWQYIFVLKKE